jgi:predicted DNA-binding transcriptional regulator AlpA
MNIHIDDMPNNALLQAAAVCAIIGVNNLTLMEMVTDGRFPQPRSINSGAAVWLVGDVKGWLAAQSQTDSQVTQ